MVKMQQPGYECRPTRKFFCYDANIACLIFAVLLILCSCVTVGLAYSIPLVFLTSVCFIPTFLAIIAFFLRNSMAGSNLLVWLYFVIECSTERQSRLCDENMRNAYYSIIFLFIVLLVELAAVYLFSYAAYLVYKNIKVPGQCLPSFNCGDIPSSPQPDDPMVVVSSPLLSVASGGSADAEALSSERMQVEDVVQVVPMDGSKKKEQWQP
uniref:Uncharacterized protein n=1 Tax=Ditylenchus dipsaci TaxID=166011 RepID=A0A915DFF6_9BILA